MAQKFRLVARKVMAGADKGTVKTYAVAKNSGYCDLDKLCNLISARSSVSSADVKAVLDSMNWAMSLELKSGNIVKVGELGNFRLGISSKGVKNAEDFEAGLITGARILFTPGASLKNTRSTVTFTPDDQRIVEKECDKEHVFA